MRSEQDPRGRQSDMQRFVFGKSLVLATIGLLAAIAYLISNLITGRNVTLAVVLIVVFAAILVFDRVTYKSRKARQRPGR